MKGMIAKLLLLAALCSAGLVYADSALYEPCATCHGAQAQGQKILSAPRLAGQNAAYLVEQLDNFKSGARGAHGDDMQGQVMAANTKNLNDKTIKTLAAFLANLVGKNNASASGDIKRGKTIYNESCLACHGVEGEGVTPLYAANLRILSAWYLERQLEAYRKAWRGHPEQGTTRSKSMRSIVGQLNGKSDEEDLIAFLTSE